MSKLASTIKHALESTEANDIVLGLCRDNEEIFCLPVWEATSEADMLSQALFSAIRWADDNGIGEIRVAYGYRDDTNTI